MKFNWIRLTWIKGLLLGVLLLPLAYFSFEYFSDYSWIIILSATFTYLLYIGVKTKTLALKILLFNISAFVFALFVYESFLCLTMPSQTISSSLQMTGDNGKTNYDAAHPDLGYAINRNGVISTKRIINDEVIYKVSYTLKDGLRHTPNSNDTSRNCVLFFGGSFTFGDGLSDSATLPFYFNHFEKQKYHVLNYGYHGYGPHQMLSQIETRVADDIQGCSEENIAIYSFASFHIKRAAGRAIWDQNGPRYELINGELIRAGKFPNIPRKVGMISQSYIFNRLFFDKKPSHYDLNRALAIIKKSNELLLQYNVILYVFIWDYYPIREMDYFLEELKKNNIKTFFVTNAITDIRQKRKLYALHDHDSHPNALANEKIARYLHLQIYDTVQTIKDR